MKIILICLSFYFTLTYIFAFNAQTHHPAKNASNISHSESHLRGLVYHQRAHSHDATTAQSSGTPLIQNRKIHPKFRPWLDISFAKTTTSISPILKDNFPLIELHQANEMSISNPTNSSNLLELFTSKPQTRKRLPFTDSYFHQQLRAFFDYRHEKLPRPNRFTYQDRIKITSIRLFFILK